MRSTLPYCARTTLASLLTFVRRTDTPIFHALITNALPGHSPHSGKMNVDSYGHVEFYGLDVDAFPEDVFPKTYVHIVNLCQVESRRQRDSGDISKQNQTILVVLTF